MTYVQNYTPQDLDRPDVEAIDGPAVIEFGTNWCGHCQAAQPAIREAFEAYPGVRHLKVEDGKGRRLGRAFGVKLWPTLVFLNNGQDIETLVRPGSSQPIEMALNRIAG